MAQTYCFKNIRFYKPEVYEKFSAMCKDSETTITKELNAVMNKSVEVGKLPSQEKVHA
jgi:hypothetical protein